MSTITDNFENDHAEGNMSGCAVKLLRTTASVCPVCLKKIPAVLERMPEQAGAHTAVFMRKECPEHGVFSEMVWHDRIDLENWISGEDPLTEEENTSCSGDCRSCMEEVSSKRDSHGQGTCCVLLEVTKRCNLRCAHCFANGGETEYEPSYEDLCRAIDDIAVKGGGPLIQLSGGEPTLRDDLPELVRYAHDAGCQYTQVNTNGIRLAEDEEFVRLLAGSGLDIVFLQFDGCDNEIYRQLRGKDLLETKLMAISNCSKYGIGVTLVPTIVRGINDGEIGRIVRTAAELFPAVRSIHFQPVTYLGRHPGSKPDHYTLDELMHDLCEQTGIPEQSLLPSRCDHAMCEFHSTFMVNSIHQLTPITDKAHDRRCDRTPAAKSRQYVAEHWRRNDNGSAESESVLTGSLPLAGTVQDPPLVSLDKEEMDFDEFVRRLKTRTMKISAMAFQDASNLDLERLYRCSLRVYEDGKLLPFCAKYLTPMDVKAK